MYTQARIPEEASKEERRERRLVVQRRGTHHSSWSACDLSYLSLTPGPLVIIAHDKEALLHIVQVQVRKLADWSLSFSLLYRPLMKMKHSVEPSKQVCSKAQQRQGHKHRKI